MKKYFLLVFLMSLFFVVACGDSEKKDVLQETVKKKPVFRNIHWGMSIDEVLKAENWKKDTISKDRKSVNGKDKIFDTEVFVSYDFIDGKVASCTIWYDVLDLSDLEYEVALELTNAFGDKLYKALIEKYGQPIATETKGLNRSSRWETPDVVIEWKRYDSGSGVKYILPDIWKAEKQKNASKI